MLSSKPVSLIVANALDASAARLDVLPDWMQQSIAADSAAHHDVMARALVQQIAAEAALPLVLAMLAAAGGPATTAELAQRWQEARDARAGDAALRPAPFSVIDGGQP